MILLVWLIIIISVIVVLFIVVRKFPQLTIVETESSSELRQNDLKKKLIEKRLNRQLVTILKAIVRLVKPLFKKIGSYFEILLQQLRKKEEEYRHKLLHKDFQDEVDKEQKIFQLLTEAQEFIGEKRYELAEEKLISIFKIDEHHHEAYAKLAKLYWEQKDYEHAIEIYNYLLKLVESPEIYGELAAIAEERGNLKEAEENYLAALKLNDKASEVYYNLAELYLQQEDNNKAQEMIEKALEAKPNHPKYLDFLLQISIIVQDKKLANETWQKLSEANSDNQKLGEYKVQIDKL